MHKHGVFMMSALWSVLRCGGLGLLIACGIAPYSVAATFALPTDGSTVVGKTIVVSPRQDNTLLDIARHFDVGYDEIVFANPHASVWLAAKQVVVPRQFILPPKPWNGIIINISQRRLFFFPPAAQNQPPQVITYPVSIAREGWSTPLGTTKITAKYRDPGWFVPKSIHDEHLKEEGVELPEYFPPGPDNPMGMLAMQTGFPGIFIHGTNKPWGVGMRTSHGCLHLYPEDAAELFPQLKPGTPVRVIDEPFLFGLDQDRWVMTSYEPVQEYADKRPLIVRAESNLTELALEESRVPLPADIDGGRIERLTHVYQSVPVDISAAQPDVQDKLKALPVEPYNFPPYGSEANNAQVPVQPAAAGERAGAVTAPPAQ